MKVVGVDGCPAGWVAVTIDDSGWTCAIHPTIESVWKASSDTARIWVDMPIGIPDTTLRNTEAACRAVLGERRSSVFSTSPRPVIYAVDYLDANAISRQLTGKGLSKQSWAIHPKIRQVDIFLRQTPDNSTLMVESHPEVVFWALNRRKAMSYNKKGSEGQSERIALLKQWYPAAEAIFEYGRVHFKRKEVGLDDIIDALCLAIGAQFEQIGSLPPEPQHDSYGLPMQVVYPVIADVSRKSAMRLVRLHHVQITVPSDRIDEARAFYLDVLGLREIPKPDSLKKRGGFWVELGGQEIHISLEDGVDRTLTKAHIAYQVENLAAWRELFESRGIQTLGNEPIPGYDRFEFRDPFGNRVEFIAPL